MVNCLLQQDKRSWCLSIVLFLIFILAKKRLWVGESLCLERDEGKKWRGCENQRKETKKLKGERAVGVIWNDIWTELHYILKQSPWYCLKHFQSFFLFFFLLLVPLLEMGSTFLSLSTQKTFWALFSAFISFNCAKFTSSTASPSSFIIFCIIFLRDMTIVRS